MRKPLSAASVTRELKALGTPAKQKSSLRFFKTGEGQYGYGDLFYGVTVPEQRRIAKHYRMLPLPEIEKLLRNKIHECRLTALFILSDRYQKASAQEKEKIADFYLKNIESVNNWDLVDSSAPYLLGEHLKNRDRSVLYELAQSENMWERRIAIMATFSFIRNGEFKDALEIAEILVSDMHDLMHKAVGWMLREVGKRSLPHEVRFLNKHANIMPRTMLRYALEKFPETFRKKYLKMKVVRLRKIK